MSSGTRTVAVLGGGSAFTPSLALALAGGAAATLPLRVRLQGRDSPELRAVAACCTRLARAAGAPHEYQAVPALADAARGAELVVNQMRVGGFAGRTHDESFPLRHGVPGDETIGPGGLASALRTVPVVLEAARTCADVAPGCWFVSLTNPMGIVLAALAGVPGVRALGLCELPGETLARALALLPAADADVVEADYLGVNHQGWFVRVVRDGRDLLPDIAAALERAPDASFFGIEPRVVRDKHALPLNYMRLYLHYDRELARQRARGASRGEELAALAAALHAACAEGRDDDVRALLGRRRMTWHADAVAPAVAALLGGPSCEVYVSQANRGHVPDLPADAIVEQRCRVDGRGATPVPWTGPPPTDRSAHGARLSFLREVLAFEDAAARAAVATDAETRRSLTLLALRAHPFSMSGAKAYALLDEVLAPLPGPAAPVPATVQVAARPAAPVAAPVAVPAATEAAALDALADGDRERAFMSRIRSGQLAATDLAVALPAFPLKIQIQTASPCNASCIMCPWPDTRTRLPQGFMHEDLFARIVDQLGGRGVERTSLFLMNEPLLDRRLERFTAQLKAAAPDTTALIFTNGSGLTADRARALAEAGMDEVNVSVVGFDRESYAEIMQDIDYDAVLANLQAVGALVRDGALGGMRVRVVGLQFERALSGLEAFRERTGLPVFLKPVTNRAGLVDVDELSPGRTLAPSFSACQRPFVKAYVLYNGDLVLCNCDWERTTIIGNLAERTLEDLWHDQRLMAIREQHRSGALAAGSICSKCDYPWLG